jgi:diguanylate cyclase (GGDEF)-like protein
MSNGTPQVSDREIGQLADENALLRASLSDARARLDELEQLGDGDMLTSLASRRQFLKELNRVVGQANRHGTPAAMLYIDLKGLKAINDRLAGDAALIHVARSLLGLIRSTDLLARIEDDMFGLILDHLDHNSAIETGERLASCIAASPVDLGGTEMVVEASVAVTSILPGDGVDEVMNRADQNMARAKTGF